MRAGGTVMRQPDNSLIRVQDAPARDVPGVYPAPKRGHPKNGLKVPLSSSSYIESPLSDY